MLNATSASVDPIHWKEDARFRCPEWAAMLVTRSGTKIRKPHAALRPSPMHKLKSSSISFPYTQSLRFVADFSTFQKIAPRTGKAITIQERIWNGGRGRNRKLLSFKQLPAQPEVPASFGNFDGDDGGGYRANFHGRFIEKRNINLRVQALALP